MSGRRNLAEKSAEDTIVSVERAFQIVEILSDQSEGLSLAELSRRLDVNKAIAVKILTTLERLGFVWRDEVAQRYQLTYRISNLGLRQLQQSRLLDQCVAALKLLAEQTGELVRLALVEKGERITWVYAIAGEKRSVRIDPNYSLEISLNTHAIGKAWLFTLPFARARELMHRHGLQTRTPFSKTDLDVLRGELEEAARRGYAVSFQENELGVGAIAAPIVVPDLEGAQECVGAVSLAAPTSRMSQAEIEACAPWLMETVRRLAGVWPLDRKTLRPLVKTSLGA